MRAARIALALAATLAAVAAPPPTPESHFGHKIGADRTVLDWDRVVAYFRALERSSDRIRVEQYGRSTEGRPLIAAVISSPETLRNLARYRDIQRRLADPRITTESEAAQLATQGRAVVMITCAIHATEIAASHTAIEFAWRLLSENKPKYRAILDNTIFILVPSLNPDGMDLVTRWYRKTLDTPFEGTSPPELYQKYVGHDNNRDWYIFSQTETRATIEKLHNVWHPHIVYDVHQQGPQASRMFVPPWMDPIEPNIDPLLVQQCNLYGMGMATDLIAEGKTGVVVNALYDFWTPARHYQAYHGGMRILSESASAKVASPAVVKPGEIERRAQGYNPRERSWNHLEPWMGGEWRLRDIIDYQLIAYESILYQAATRREDLLRNFYRIGKRATERATPFAFWIPADQLDPGATRKLVETLEFAMVEIERLSGGGYLIPMRQPYSGFAKTLLERQQYPDLREYPGGPPKRPYDVTAHTLPLLMGVRVEAVDARPAAGPPAPKPPAGILVAADSDSWVAVNKAWAAGTPVWRDISTGDFSLAARPGWKELPRPRIGMYKSFIPNIDEGWTRWILEQFGFAHSSPGNREIRAGDLHSRYDVLLFADQGAASIERGYSKDSMPEEYTGGLGAEGAAALREFATQGGTLVFLNRATTYASQLGLKIQDATRGVSSRDLYVPGSLLNVRLQAGNPLTLGLPEQVTIWNEASPVWDVAEGSVARYPDSGLLASGWLLGEKHLVGKSALVEVPLGAGRVVLFGMRPQYRAQSYLTLKLLFNALVKR